VGGTTRRKVNGPEGGDLKRKEDRPAEKEMAIPVGGTLVGPQSGKQRGERQKAVDGQKLVRDHYIPSQRLGCVLEPIPLWGGEHAKEEKPPEKGGGDIKFRLLRGKETIIRGGD